MFPTLNVERSGMFLAPFALYCLVFKLALCVCTGQKSLCATKNSLLTRLILLVVKKEGEEKKNAEKQETGKRFDFFFIDGRQNDGI